ncbi:MAG: hypothetical protein Q3996_00365 [Candidatus Saccharibacteria bacterium]|nr:hypothetical protein [Candidatus Saccharibacteria bacterium]
MRDLNKKRILILLSVLLGLFVIISLIYIFINNQSNNSRQTGGSGVPEKNTIIIFGWEKTAKNGFSIGEMTSLRWQNFITKAIVNHLISLHGEFDYKEATISDINSEYNKSTNTDMASFILTINDSNEKYKIVLDYNNTLVNIYFNTQKIDSTDNHVYY